MRRFAAALIAIGEILARRLRGRRNALNGEVPTSAVQRRKFERASPQNRLRRGGRTSCHELCERFQTKLGIVDFEQRLLDGARHLQDLGES